MTVFFSLHKTKTQVQIPDPNAPIRSLFSAFCINIGFFTLKKRQLLCTLRVFTCTFLVPCRYILECNSYIHEGNSYIHECNRYGALFRCAMPYMHAFKMMIFGKAWSVCTCVCMCACDLMTDLAGSTSACSGTAIPIIIEGLFQAFQRFSSSKLVLKTVESCFVALNYYGNGSTYVHSLCVLN